MADQKITQLTSLDSAPASTDVVPIVDIDDTTMAGSGTTKKISVTNLLASKADSTHTHAIGDITGTVPTSQGGTALTAIGTALQVIQVNSGATALEFADNAHLELGTTSSTALAGDTTTISAGQASAITANTAKTGITSGQASAITANTAKTGITSGQASAITANTAKTGITSGQASAITANTAKTGITSGQASAITANTAKTGITSGQASAITANTAKTGITSGQASAITANTAKTTNATHTSEVTGATALTVADDVIDEANLKADNTPTDDDVLTAKSSAAGGLTWAAASGSGDVIKVGTPVDNQVGVWTGDGTIEGTSSLVFNSTGLGVGTATPTLVKLDVVGAIGQSGAVWATGARANSLVIDNNGGAARFHAVGADATTMGSFNFYTAETDGGATSRMTISSAGVVKIEQKLGIGRVAATMPLEVQGTVFGTDVANGGVSVYGLTGDASTTGSIIGVRGTINAIADSATTATGVYGDCQSDATTGKGVHGSATGAGAVNYGVYGDASGATSNYGGYFYATGDDVALKAVGNVHFTNDANTIKLSWDATNERLGIGRTPSTYALEVAGDVAIYSGNYRMGDSGGAASGNSIYSPASDVIGISTGGTERMRIDSVGHLGVGTTPVDSNSFGRALDVVGPTGASLFVRNGSAPTTNYGYVGFYSNGLYVTNSTTGGDLFFRTENTTKMVLTSGGDCQWHNTSSAVKMTWDSSASALGIGTAVPAAPLNVQGPDAGTIAIFNGPTGTTTRGLKLSLGTDGVTNNVVNFDAQHSAGILAFQTGGTERLRITSAGRVTVKKASNSEITTLTSSSASTAVNLNDANNFKLALSEYTTLANPTNITAGQSGAIVITQDEWGYQTMAYGSYWDFEGGVAPELSESGDAVDTLVYYVASTTSIHAVLLKDMS